MTVSAIDHVAIPVANVSEMLRFYRALGFTAPLPEEWLAGRQSHFAVVLGNQKINMHAPALWQRPGFTLRGPTAQPGCGDFCFVWDGSVEAVKALLASVGAAIEEGPVARIGGRGQGRAEGTSVYTRDPDRNLLEFIVYPS